MSRYTFLWGIVNAAAAAAAPSPEAVPQQGLSGGADALQSSHELWSQQAWPLDKCLLCSKRPDFREQMLSKLQSSHLLEEITSTHPKPLLVLYNLASRAKLLRKLLMPRTATLAERSSWWAPHIDPKPWISLSLRAEDQTTCKLGI